MLSLFSAPVVSCIAMLGTSLLCSSFALADEKVDFSREILPLLSDTCFQCHGPDEGAREADLRFDDQQNVLQDRDSYAIVVPGDSENSELMRRLTTEDPSELMPPADLHRPLSAKQIETVRTWIEQGAEWGQHWAFNRVERPAVPTGKHAIDYFVDRRLADLGWQAAPRADRRTLIRRLSLDLTGLPPTPQQVQDFLNDNEPDSWKRLVDQTLASPAFGERMAWNWLDAARYADTNGYQGDKERTMWPWRDWVVRAFNDNLPYDEFTLWQLAGDLLPKPSQDQILATAFNRNHMINGEGGRIPEENRVDYVLDMTETMATVWLGLTLNCCRCHDHKFDPLAQQEYYSLTAFFNQTPVTGAGGSGQTKPVLLLSGEQEFEILAEAKKREQELLEPVISAERLLWPRPQGRPTSESVALEQYPKQLREIAIKIPDRRKSYEHKHLTSVLAKNHPDWNEKYAKFTEAQENWTNINNKIVRVMVMKDRDEPRKTYILERGIYNQPQAEVPAAVPAVMPPLPSDLPANRLALARWLVARDHPLTSRVTVNRFWQMLFGIGLVKTTEDFGVQAEFPHHPDLLDWLAAEFMDSGWDTKQLLRTLVTSDAYTRDSAIAAPEEYERDPDNRYFARGARFRMPSWMIRDQALAISGLLNREMGGTPVKSYQPEGVWEEASFGKMLYQPDHGDALYRRSLYTFWRRIIGPTMFFDSARRQICEVKVARTNTPMHALATLNDVTYVEAARTLAEQLLLAEQDTTPRFRMLAERVLARPPTEQEAALWLQGLQRAEQEFADYPERAEQFLAIGESPRNPSLPQGEHAAWTTVCLNALNLDETFTKE